ncbi:hypothetical protein Bca101_065915 [Brassica carinata]
MMVSVGAKRAEIGLEKLEYIKRGYDLVGLNVGLIAKCVSFGYELPPSNIFPYGF